MEWFTEHWLALLFIGGYLALLAHHAWKGTRRSKTLDDYLVGGRGLSGVIVALSYYATFVSSVTFIGHAGKSYSRGPAWWIVCVVTFTSMVFLAWFVVAPRFVTLAAKYKALTIPDFLGYHYRSQSLRWLAGVVVVASSVAYMVAVYSGAAKTLETLIDLDARLIMLLIFLVVTAYTLAGGFHSVVLTDAVQGLILMSAAVLLPTALIIGKGGIGPLIDSVREAKPTALDWPDGMGLLGLVGLALGVGFKFIVEPRQLSRFYGLASNHKLRYGRWLAPALLFATNLLMLPVGFLAYGYVRSPDQFTVNGRVDTDLVVPYLLGEADVLGPIAGAFFLTALVAAAMSSLDSVLLVAASSVDHDLIHPGRDQHAAMRLTRIWVVLLSAVAAALALVPGRGIVEISSFSGSMYAACFIPTLIIGLFWRRATASGSLAALAVGFIVTLVWFFSKGQVLNGALVSIHEIYLGLAAALLVFVIVSLVTQATVEESRVAHTDYGVVKSGKE